MVEVVIITVTLFILTKLSEKYIKCYLQFKSEHLIAILMYHYAAIRVHAEISNDVISVRRNGYRYNVQIEIGLLFWTLIVKIPYGEVIYHD